ncbi:non-ribosomal peptide synthetase [Actinokineospora globicatena]|uniref:non-ribosomal peptide synthetase n=1 Tax=Actinokineospora globicatena TaxID=103729 RepID=UPI0020A4DD4D|nr:non-ribosomal peptide synthetase [Actinokineospora globicatena]MCP2303903.1 amino acid adenylation domain-containing protein [Actinokineospora globicatena]GLW78937.1 hypothetical protein Aglo01_34190 [Actinokineospora globicatena]GLW86651.1 hypothetical protein Aglo02_42900 [Actinokineospora globicatena]
MSSGTDGRDPNRPIPVRRFEDQARRTPHAVAVECAGETLTYAELDHWATWLARDLIACGARSERSVAVVVRRSVRLVVALVAVAKAGSACLPLDPHHPEARRAAVVAVADPVLVLTQVADGPTGGGADLAVDLAAEHLAYIRFTSGSTGAPKGVAVTHGNLSALLAEFTARLRLGVGDRLLAVTTTSFDIAELEVWAPLVTGACVVLADEHEHRDPARVAALLGRAAPTVVQGTPTLWQAVLEAAPAPLDLSGVRLLVGGEPLSESLARRLRATGAEVTNAYGPTETTVWSTAKSLGHADGEVTIGTPIKGTRAYVLDPLMRPVAAGEMGELYLAGAGVARGYVGSAGLTAKRFVAEPDGPAGARMYRTGDLVRVRPDGDLVFVGRADDQVKIRGFRVELGEVESALAALPGVVGAVAQARADHTGASRLVAYVVAGGGASVGQRALRAALADVLPAHMVPSAVVVLDEFPRSSNGKVDKAALPAPDFSGATGRGVPRTEGERRLCSLFAQVLGLPAVGVDDDFFDLGGHSLLATRLVVRLRADFGVEISLRDLFEAPTARAAARKLAVVAVPRPLLGAGPRPRRIPLSPAQRGLWFLDQVEDLGGTYTLPLTLHLAGVVDAEALRAALADLVGRHESLRTAFAVTEDGEPWQRVLAPEQSVPEFRLRSAADPAEAAAARDEFLGLGFDLASRPPVRALLITIGADLHQFVLAVHHIVVDGWSMTPLVDDLLTAYAARRSDQPPPWSDLPVQYADYALWQRRLLGGADEAGSVHARQLAYWRTALAGLPDQLDLPYDRPRSARPSYRGGAELFRISAETHQSLVHLARAEAASVFMVCHAALAAMLTMLGAGTDIPVGTPVAGRDHPALDDLVGFFVNTVVVRVDTAGDPDFRTLLGRVRRAGLDALEHRDLPFESLVEAINPPRSLARHPLFQVLLVNQSTVPAPRSVGGVDVVVDDSGPATAKFDLSMSLVERWSDSGTPAGVDVTVEFAADLFDHETVRRVCRYFQRVLDFAASDPGEPLSRVELVAPEERHRLLVDLNATEHPVDQRGLPELLAAQARRSPGAVAVVHEGAELDYAALETRSNQLARVLIGRGVGPEATVALLVPRSIDLIIAMVAVVKAGAAYLPLDPDYPAERTAYMVEDSRPVCLLTTAAMTPRAPEGAPVHLLDAPESRALCALESGAAVADAERLSPLSQDHPVYVIYTSGSTGRPKGVVFTVRALVNLLAWHAEVVPGGPGTVTGQFASLSFDAAAQEIFSALTSGKTVAVPRDEIRKDMDEVVRWLDHDRVNELFAPTPAVNGIAVAAQRLGTALSELTTIAQAGEALTLHRPIQQLSARLPDLRILNYYGPTETHVVTGCAVPREVVLGGGSPPIGPPIWNTRAYILDETLRPVPEGVRGELYLAGTQVARGYLNRPGLTASRFIADPFSARGDRMYRTGDLARWLSDGSIQFLGRNDFQVKVRGFRVELGEVESAVAALPGVEGVVVVAREDLPGDKRLVAYVVLADGARSDPLALRRSAQRALPDYMVPAAVVVLAEFPLNPNGKVDRAVLPAPDYGASTKGTAPRTARERHLCRLFAEVLGVERVGVDDDFFELGGHSLLATRLISLVRAETRCELGIRDLFDHPTVLGVARSLVEPAVPRPVLRRTRAAEGAG